MAGPPAPYPSCPPYYYPPSGYYWPPPQFPIPRGLLQLLLLLLQLSFLSMWRGGSSSTAPIGVYTMHIASTLGHPDVVSGTLDVDSHDAHVLFDSGATFSFISLDFARRANISS